MSDRLRPIFLTTATTLIGLAPMLFEKSSQAIFLKPTVITLVFGLGFGMCLVVFLVPAVLAIQADWTRQRRAFGRVLRGRTGLAGMRGLVAGAAALTTLSFVLTLGSVLVRGQMPGWIFGALPMLGQIPAAFAGLALFLIATLVIVAATWVIGRMTLRPPSARPAR